VTESAAEAIGGHLLAWRQQRTGSLFRRFGTVGPSIDHGGNRYETDFA